MVGDYEITDLVGRFTDMTVGARASVPEGQLDLGGADDDRAQSTADNALAIARCAGPISDAVVAVGASGLLDEIETPLVRVLARMEQDQKDAVTLKVSATPEYFVNGRPLPSFGQQQLLDLVREELNKAY